MIPLQATAQHLATLACAPGWREYVGARINELESCESGLWRGLRAEDNAAVALAKNQREGKT